MEDNILNLESTLIGGFFLTNLYSITDVTQSCYEEVNSQLIKTLLANSSQQMASFLVDMRYTHQDPKTIKKELQSILSQNGLRWVQSSSFLCHEPYLGKDKFFFVHLCGNIVDHLDCLLKLKGDTHLMLTIYDVDKTQRDWRGDLFSKNSELQNWFLLKTQDSALEQLRENCKLLIYKDEGTLYYLLDPGQLAMVNQVLEEEIRT